MLPTKKVDQEQFNEYKGMQRREHNLTRWVVGISAGVYMGICLLLYGANQNQIQAYRAETKALIESDKAQTRIRLDAHNEKIKQNEEMIKMMYSYFQMVGGKK